MVSALKELYNLEMDYQGQKLAEQLYQCILILFTIVGLIWGYYCQQFIQTFYFICTGFLLSAILILPPWPMFRSHPLTWRQSNATTKKKIN